MKKFNKDLIATALAISFFVLGLAGPLAARAATTPSLGAAATYGVLGGTYSNSSAATTINGDVGFTTAPATTPLGIHPNYGPGVPTPTARIDAGSALATGLATQTCTFNFAAGAIDLSTDTTHGPIGVYTPGVYCSTGAMNIGVGGITLSGSGTYIFRAVGALTSTDNSHITLSGASACDVFWTPTSATTLGANTTFAGTIIDNANAISVGANTTWIGRALSLGAGTVTTGDTDTITVPTCATAATLHVIKLVVNGNGGTAVPANFTVHVKNLGADVLGSPALGTAAPGTSYSLSAGTYVVSENVNTSYVQSFGGDCDSSGNVTLSSGGDKVCSIINTDIPAPAPVTNNSAGGRIIPMIGILKVPSPLALPAGPGPVTYNYTVWNVGGQQALINVTVTDDKCSPVAFLSGDLNSNSKLDPHENWKYSCTATVPNTITNTSVATGHSDDGFNQPAIATAIATVVVGKPLPPPLINIVKVPSRMTPFPFGGGDVTYAYTVTNPGVVAMHNVVVTDDKCGPVSGSAGDTNNNGLLDPGETWTYTCRMNVPVSTSNVATAKGEANGFTALGYAFATVLVAAPGLPDTGLPPEGANFQWDIAIIAAILSLVFVSLILTVRKRKDLI